MHPQELFETNIDTIERVIAVVCRRARLIGADAEDFASEARLALIENDYAILAKYEGRSALDTFLTVVIQRLFSDARMHARGRWHPSSEAQRLGPAAVLLETLVLRDGRSFDEALPHMRVAHPDLTREEMAAMLDRLPRRVGRPRAVELDAIGYAIAGGDSADTRVNAGDRQRISGVVERALREFLGALPVEDRMLIRMRFGSEMSIADIARMMSLPQRPLYRRLEALLMRLRTALAAAGVDGAMAEELVGRDDANELDFGLLDNQVNGKSGLSGQSIRRVKDHAGEEP
jgi:RNA polymerase sigma factor (sigma-70 family)